MKISLIYPYVSTVERYGADIGEIGGRQSPLGILYLSSFLKSKKHDVQVIDAESERLDDGEVLEKLKFFLPNCIGISTTSAAFNSAAKLAAKIRRAFDGIKIIAGGPHITANLADALKRNDFDFGIFGEGELTLAELLKKMDRPEEHSEIKGLIHKNSKGKIIVNQKREYLSDLDSLPYPDRDSLPDIKLYRPPVGCYREEFAVSLMTSRGCPYGCIFCDNNTFGRKIRYFSPEYVIGEIECVLKKYDAKELTFVDDTFPSNKKRFTRILEMMRKRNLKVSWTCMANISDLDEKLLKLMKEAGCWQIAFGIESGDENILKFIGKSAAASKIRRIVAAANKIGIMAKGFFMLGHPTETKETMGKTKMFALELPLTDAVCTISTPIKGTALYDIAMSGQYGEFNSEADTSQFNYWKPVFVPSGMTENDLYSAQRDFYRSFYLRPRIIFRQLKKIRNIKILLRCVSSLLKLAPWI